MSIAEKLTEARTHLVLEQPFFGALVMHLPLIADPTCKTAMTNGVVIRYNPKFVESLSHKQTVALLAHEVDHVAMGHPWRRDARDPRGWNIACDKTINQTLRDAGFELPDGVYYAKGEEVGMSAEWIYGKILEEQAKQQSQKQSQQTESEDQDEDDDQDQDDDQDGDDSEDDSQDDDDADGEDGDGKSKGDGEGDAEPDAQNGAGGDDDEGDPLGGVEDAPTEPDADGNAPPSEQEWKERVVVAMQQAKLMGKMPGGLERQIEDSIQPRVDVRSLLLRFFSERSNSDYSWTRPSTRYIASGLYLPALQDHALGEVAIMVDTSGSISDMDLKFARNLIEQVIDECSPTGVTVYYSDAEVAGVDRFEKGEPLTWRPRGGGGTDFRPVLDAIEKEGAAVCTVCITDLCGTFPDVAPSYPVLWLVPKSPWTSSELNAPFGETIHFDQ